MDHTKIAILFRKGVYKLLRFRKYI